MTVEAILTRLSASARRLVIGLAAVAGLEGTAQAATIGYSVRAHASDRLFSIDLETGLATDLGQLLFGDAEGLAFSGGRLYATGGLAELWDVTTAPGVKVGDTGFRMGHDAGLAEHPSGALYNLQASLAGYSSLYLIDPVTGAANFVATSSGYADSAAIDAQGRGFAVDGVFTDSLYSLDFVTGQLARIGSLGLGNTTFHSGLAFDASGVLWMTNHYGQIFTIDTATGTATFVADITSGGYKINGFQGLAIDLGGQAGLAATQAPEPGTLGLLAAGGIAAAFARHRRVRSLASRAVASPTAVPES